MTRKYTFGILCLIVADLFWGLAFIIPKLLPFYSAVEITAGRYFVYGLLSVVLWLIERNREYKLNRDIWFKALLFALCGNIGYYLLLVMAIQTAGAVLPTLIIGILPVSISLYGNWLNREFPFQWLLIPVIIILSGLCLINYTSLKGMAGIIVNPLGIIYSMAALGLWTFYGVANARFLRENPHISAKSWANIIGTATVILLPVLIVVIKMVMPRTIAVANFFQGSWRFWLGSLILGAFASWSGAVLWNKAAHILPVSLAGQLIVGETVFGLGYSFVLDRRFPSYFELTGMIMVIGGVIFGIQRINNLKAGIIDYVPD